MSFTLATLKSTVQDYCETSETTFVADLDTFIKESEERILKNVELPVFRKNVTGSAASSNTYLSTPTDFLAPYSLAVISSSVYSYLLFKHVSFIRELHYKYRPASLTTTSGTDTTWLSSNAPDALLYGTLVEAATFLKIPEEVAQYEQRFVQAINSLKNLGQGYGSRDEYRYDIAKG